MIVFDHVCKTYPNGVKGLDDVSLNIEQGEFVGIIGLSGAGKSTLIRAVNRMHDITEGVLMVDDTDVSTLRGKALRRFPCRRCTHQGFGPHRRGDVTARRKGDALA